MAYPPEYDPDYSFTGFAQSQGDNSFPGTQLDNELAMIRASINGLDAFIEGSFNAEGVLKPGKTADTEDFAEAVAEAEAAAATATSAAASAGVSATSAASSAGAAAASATTAANAAAIFPPLAASQFLRGNDAGTAWVSRDYTSVRTDLGLVIGTNVQAYDADLQAIAALVSAADRLPYATGAGTWSLATFTAAGRALVDDADATAQRATLGLGTIATQAASAVAITGGTITGITDLAIADGGTGASDAPTARTNLGLGTMATQAASAVAITGGSITGITDLAVADGGTGASTAAAARTNLGVAIGSNVQAWDADLDAIAALTSAADQAPYATGTSTWAMMTVTAAARTVLDDTTVAAMRTTLGAYASAGGDLSGLVTQSAGNGLVVGGTALVAGVYAGSAVTLPVQVQAAGTTGLAAYRAGASASPPIFGAYKTRGASASAHTAVAASDQLFAFVGGGSDGTAYRDGFRMIATVTGAPTATNVPTRWDILTGDGTSSFVGVGGDQNGNLQVNQQTVITQARHIQLRSYTVATLPSAATAGQLIYVSDGTSNKRLAVSDGTNWRWPDGAIVS